MGDSEVEAMAAVASALVALDQDARGRVIKWAADRYGVILGGGPARLAGQIARDAGEIGSSLSIDAPHVDEMSVMSAVSAETSVAVEKLEKVFHIDGAAVKLLGPSSSYGASTAAQARAVAQVVTVVRRLGMGNADTSFDLIRDACIGKYCYDSKNFATVLQSIDGYVVKGDGKSRRLEAKGAAVAAFPALIDKILEKP